MTILALDQARDCGWSVFELESGKLIDCGHVAYPHTKYTYAQAVMNLERDCGELITKYGVEAVFLEGIQLRKNPKSYCALAQLQGVLINMCEKAGMFYRIIEPTQWQCFCGARCRTEKEKRAKLASLDTTGKKVTKILSIEYVRNKYGIDICNDNIADAVCIGDYVVNHKELFGGTDE